MNLGLRAPALSRVHPFAALVGLLGLSLGGAACGGETPAAPPVVAPPPPMPATAEPAPVAAPPPPAPTPAAPAGPAQLTAKAIPLPGATAPVMVDYLTADRPRGRVWVPVGDTGTADVFDVATGTFTRVEGFKTAERDVRGKKRLVGPSSAGVSDAFAFIGNRATSEVCAVDAKTMKLGKCLKLASSPDGVTYVPSTKEVWVTTPRDHSLTVLDASKPDTLKVKAMVKIDGDPEGYAIDETRGLFFTNVEDKDKTLAIDLKTRAIKATYAPGCGTEGPRGLVVDVTRNFIVVACTDHLQVLDAGHDGALLGKLDTGAGVDNIDYLAGLGYVYAASGKAGKLSVVKLDDKGQLALVATAATAEGTRNTVADDAGNAYVLDGLGARLFVVPAPPK